MVSKFVYRICFVIAALLLFFDIVPFPADETSHRKEKQKKKDKKKKKEKKEKKARTEKIEQN